MVGLSRFELLTSRLSGVRSDQLSYRPLLFLNKYNPQSLKDLFYFHIILLSTKVDNDLNIQISNLQN